MVLKNVPDPDVEQGSGPQSQSCRVFSNIGSDPLKKKSIKKLPSYHSMLGHHLPASKTPFKWQFASGPMMARSAHDKVDSYTLPMMKFAISVYRLRAKKGPAPPPPREFCRHILS